MDESEDGSEAVSVQDGEGDDDDSLPTLTSDEEDDDDRGKLKLKPKRKSKRVASSDSEDGSSLIALSDSEQLPGGREKGGKNKRRKKKSRRKREVEGNAKQQSRSGEKGVEKKRRKKRSDKGKNEEPDSQASVASLGELDCKHDEGGIILRVDGDQVDDEPAALAAGNAGGDPAPVPTRKQKRQAALAKRQARNEMALSPDRCDWYKSHREEEDQAGGNPPENRPDDEVAPCCTDRCCDSYHSATTGLIRAYHMALSPADQRRFWRSRIRQPNRPEGQIAKYKRTRHFYLETAESVQKTHTDWKNVTNRDEIINRPADSSLRRVCVRFFAWCILVSMNRLYQRGMTKPVEGSVISPMKVTRARDAPKRATAVAAMQYLGKYETIILPQSGERILEIPKKADALAYAKGICESKFDPAVVPSKKYLDRIWRTDDEFKNIKVHRTLPFSKCDTCSEFDTAYSRTSDPAARKEIIAKKQAHKALVSQDRDGYYTRGAKATMRPREFMSLIVDGADQSKYELPYRPRSTKTADTLWKQKIHVMGAISHGRRVSAFISTDDIKHGNNVTIEVIHRVLWKTLEDEEFLPPVLFLQLDNTTRQCKAQYVMAYLHSLVDAGVFKKIVVSFLPVGHTHEDIDQFFSVLSKTLKHQNCYTREELAAIIAKVLPKHEGYKHPVHVELMDEIANYSHFVKNRVKMPEGIMDWHQFRFFKENGVGPVHL